MCRISAIKSRLPPDFSLARQRRVQLRRPRHRRMGPTYPRDHPGEVLPPRRYRRDHQVPIRRQWRLLPAPGRRARRVPGLRQVDADDSRARCVRHGRQRRHRQGSAGDRAHAHVDTLDTSILDVLVTWLLFIYSLYFFLFLWGKIGDVCRESRAFSVGIWDYRWVVCVWVIDFGLSAEVVEERSEYLMAFCRYRFKQSLTRAFR